MITKLIGYGEALKLTLLGVSPLAGEMINLSEGTDYIAAEDLYARVDSPSVNASLKDGYAVLSHEVAEATPENPVFLKLGGLAAAGVHSESKVKPGMTVRVLTGAGLPEGADAVVAEEFATEQGDIVKVTAHAELGRNILPKGSDVAKGEIIISKGSTLVPGMVGILAAAGYAEISAIPKPRVAIIATGDEVVAPGKPLPKGKLFASNLATLNAWCRHFGMRTTMDIVRDNADLIMEKLVDSIDSHDAVLTSGGAWTGDRDFVGKMLDQIGWKKVYHRIRMGPGKAVGFGTVNGKPVFILPGGPPSNLMAFLQIALPGLLKLAGHQNPELPRVDVKLTDDVEGQTDWTQFIYGLLEKKPGTTLFKPLRLASRLKSMARAEGIISIPEGMNHIPAGANITAQLLV
ncbi:gephyrin-like molybdotransferase Glp [Thermodesulfobacteriota bacterium]